jgi:hypothetical protein
MHSAPPRLRHPPSACNYTTEAGCTTSSEGCHWLPEYEVRRGGCPLADTGGAWPARLHPGALARLPARTPRCPVSPHLPPTPKLEVAPNPLNFSKPCVLASTSSPIESVLLGHGNVSQAVVAAQLECTQRFDEPSCTKGLVRASGRAARGGPCPARSGRQPGAAGALEGSSSPPTGPTRATPLTQIPINSSSLGDALAFSAAKAPFEAAAWAGPGGDGDGGPPREPRLPLPLPVASANPLKRASSAWHQQQAAAQQGAAPAAAGDSVASAAADPSQPGGVHAAAGKPPLAWPVAAAAAAQGRCPAGLEGRCPARLHASQAKLRLLFAPLRRAAGR